MEVIKLETFDIADTEELVKSLNKFITEHGERKSFNELNENNLRKQIWTQLFKIVNNKELESAHMPVLAALRILSRDKTEINEVITHERIKILLTFAHLDGEIDDKNINFCSSSTVEALKLLCNLIYHSQEARILLVETSCLSQTVQRISKHRNSLSHEGRLFHLRLLFLLTALSINTRNIVKNQLKGDLYLTEILADISKRLENENASVLESEDAATACEVLKVLFNLYIRSEEEEEEEEIEDEKYKKLVSILYDLLILENISKHEELKSHIVNLLTVVPKHSYTALIPRLENDNDLSQRNIDTRAISKLLDFLDQRLDSEIDLTENNSPILTVLIRLAKAQRFARKYIRLQILPPLKDVMKRPEEGSTIRAKMCKQLTSPQTNLRDLVAELIFILCKENVSRMVKYTGYGNAAGMFANKGLLGGNQSKSNYSSESEDSDTDEYIRYKEQINPITGCYESPKPNPTEGMSEERKEYEALQLAQLIDKLTREGIVQPCRIGEDGRPKPIEHVLELQSDSK